MNGPRFKGKVAVITGGASGIGLATARLLANEGASVMIGDINAEGAERAAAGIVAGGAQASSCWVDVQESAAVLQLVERACERFGGVDILHNNAAALQLVTVDFDVVSIAVETWDQTLAVNLKGVMLGCKHAVPVMRRRGGGVIINTASTAGLAGNLAAHAYGTSKSAVMALTRHIATAYGREGIRCNAVAPGFVDTAGARGATPARNREIIRRNTPWPRLGTADDIARAVAFLASDDAEYINGQTLAVDGGMLSHTPFFSDLVYGSPFEEKTLTD